MWRSLMLALLLCLTTQAQAESRYDSWQVRHPVATGFMAAVTLWQVPERFGNDLVQVDDRMENGWTIATLDLLMPHAKSAYQASRIIISIFEALLLCLVIVNASRKGRK